MAQSGQYNYVRSMKRSDNAGAFFALGEFIKETVCAVHLLNHSYTPFYKWMWKSLTVQKRLTEVQEPLKSMLISPFSARNADLIEKVCILLKEELIHQTLTDEHCDFLEPHGRNISLRIRDPELKNLPVIYT